MKTSVNFLTYLAYLFVEWEMFPTKIVEKIKNIWASVTFFFFENRAVYEIMCKNIVGPGRLQVTIWRMRIACCIPTCKNTHLEYVILIVFPLLQWLDERTCTYFYCLYCFHLMKLIFPSHCPNSLYGLVCMENCMNCCVSGFCLFLLWASS
jgi:hypothetical protein